MEVRTKLQGPSMIRKVFCPNWEESCSFESLKNNYFQPTHFACVLPLESDLRRRSPGRTSGLVDGPIGFSNYSENDSRNDLDRLSN